MFEGKNFHKEHLTLNTVNGSEKVAQRVWNILLNSSYSASDRLSTGSVLIDVVSLDVWYPTWRWKVLEKIYRQTKTLIPSNIVYELISLWRKTSSFTVNTHFFVNVICNGNYFIFSITCHVYALKVSYSIQLSSAISHHDYELMQKRHHKRYILFGFFLKFILLDTWIFSG